MVTDEVRRAKLKTAHTLRTQFQYKIGLDRIDYKVDVIDPTVKEVGIKAKQGILPEFIIEEDTDEGTSNNS